ncbi:response regulator receiver domain [Klebsiella pneumoniae]|nr:response regulator receiver domain [Klebsiella pneumoniae]
MNSQNYNMLVNRTYCSNAIRSVMLIDDDFLTYSDSIDKLLSGMSLDERKVDGSKRAAQLERFFQEKKILCDIDDGSVNFDVERIKKSDLIIIDYHLENNSPLRTLETLDKLRESAQFNLIIVYTNEDLTRVWKEICATFIGTVPANSIIETIDSFEVTEFWDNTLKLNIDNGGVFCLSELEILEYLKTSRPIRRIAGELFRNTEFKTNGILKQHSKCLILAIIQENISKYNLLNKIHDAEKDICIMGDCGESKWIKSGNVFISLFNKTANLDDDEAAAIWDNLSKSLYEWKPSYYNILKSEIQNKIEAEALSFEVQLDNDIYGQAAWLNEVLKNSDLESRKDKIDFIFKNIAEELYFKLRKNENLNEFICEVFTHFENDFNESKNQDNVDIQRLKFCAESMGLEYNQDCNNDMYHALNMNTSSRNYREKYLSTGTVLFDEENHDWYLCVSAACDMVPSQGNDAYHKRLKPHRLIQVLKLFNTDAKNAISHATHSKYIYIFEKTATPPRKYFSVTNPVTGLPQLDYMVVLNHSTEKDKRNIKAMVLGSKEEEVIPTLISLKLKSQLRTGYAERYQLMASQYGSRIGVDYFGIEIPD